MIFDRLDFYLDDTPRTGTLNMAIDETLARSTDQPALRVYRWAQPSVSFGYFGCHREVASRWPGREFVRRWTGGGEVPHGEDFTYTLAVPRAHAFSRTGVRESYRVLHTLLAALIPGAALAEQEEGEAAACFAHPVFADVLLAGRKIAGAAQRRGSFGLLHQGSVQVVTLTADFGAHLAAAFAAEIRAATFPPALLADAERLAAEKYRTPAWLERA
jgi:lipoate-protein ligase A